MTTGPSYDLGHLVVAAIRVLSHRLSRPPTLHEAGELLGFSPEFTGQVLRRLEDMGVVRTLRSAFDDRFEIIDSLALEELPKEEKTPGMEADLEDFEKRYREKQEKLEHLFGSDELDKQKKDKIRSMEDELKSFKGKKKTFDTSLFKDGEEED
jgi:DNA-binding MarR family transcriptional regulator